jgi:Rieske Fe-S protein
MKLFELAIIGLPLIYLCSKLSSTKELFGGAVRKIKNVVLGSDNKYVVQYTDGTSKILSRECPHAGCDVDYKNGEFVCPCHGSKFNAEGTVTQGPATQNLESS